MSKFANAVGYLENSACGLNAVYMMDATYSLTVIERDRSHTPVLPPTAPLDRILNRKGGVARKSKKAIDGCCGDLGLGGTR